MQLRCKDGDFAVVVREHQGCESNLGQVVHVRGPLKTHLEDGPMWRISPVLPMTWSFLSADRRSLHKESPLTGMVRHPDAWLVPIRNQPDMQTQGCEQIDLDAPAVAVCSKTTRISADSAARRICVEG